MGYPVSLISSASANDTGRFLIDTLEASLCKKHEFGSDTILLTKDMKTGQEPEIEGRSFC